MSFGTMRWRRVTVTMFHIVTTKPLHTSSAASTGALGASLVDGAGQVIPDRVEVNGVFEPGREGGHGLVRVVPGPVKPAFSARTSSG